MKDWGYYNKPKSPYPGSDFKTSLLKQKIEALDEIPMTKKERREAEEKAKEAVALEVELVRTKYQEEQNKLDAEFYQDCRKELMYDEYLNEEQCKILEGRAYQEGHSCGYSEIYNDLIDLEEMVAKIIDAGKIKVDEKKKKK